MLNFSFNHHKAVLVVALSSSYAEFSSNLTMYPGSVNFQSY